MAHVDSEYATMLRDIMAGQKQDKRPVTIRELSTATGRHYEHIRKLVAGEPVVSEELNHKIAAFLGVDERRLWRAAQRDKLRRKFSDEVLAELGAPADPQMRRLIRLWPMLSLAGRKAVVQLAEQQVGG